MRGEPNYLHEEWMHKTVPIVMESVVMMHYVPDKSDLSYLNLLDNFNLGLTLMTVYLFSFFGILALSFLFDELARRIRYERRRTIQFSKRIVSAVSSFGVKRLSAIGLFVLFVHLFIWITQLFITNNIKTNKVVRLSRSKSQNGYIVGFFFGFLLRNL